MKYTKKNLSEITLVLALIIACFPDEFKKIGEILIQGLFNNGATNNLLIIITLLLLYICRECWLIKKMNKTKKDDFN